VKAKNVFLSESAFNICLLSIRSETEDLESLNTILLTEGNIMIAVSKLNLWKIGRIVCIESEEVTHYGPVAVVKLNFLQVHAVSRRCAASECPKLKRGLQYDQQQGLHLTAKWGQVMEE
jgi:hypothetical protein